MKTFSLTYICKCTFSAVNFMKAKYRPNISNENLAHFFSFSFSKLLSLTKQDFVSEDIHTLTHQSLPPQFQNDVALYPAREHSTVWSL